MLDHNQGMFPIRMKLRLFFFLAMAILALPGINSAAAWGPLGHATIGHAATVQLSPPAQARLMEILAVTSREALTRAVDRACFWPDTVRDSPAWSWSASQHYVNIPRSSERYDRQRDCPEGRCATEAILRYAADLSRPGLDHERSWQAFAWLCHLVGDLHQPLHAGFLDDRGGNEVDIIYRGKHANLHRFWDSILAEERMAGKIGDTNSIDSSAGISMRVQWKPSDVVDWTEESHRLATVNAYPPDTVITDDFADASWAIIQLQWRRAATRLALILNTLWTEQPAVPRAPG